MSKIRLGRIAFINVEPIYYALEREIIPHSFQLVADTPARLNNQMRDGQLAISSCSCIEYARRFRQYYLAKDLCISSYGPVMSVLLLSQKPFTELTGKEILVSGQSHTSVVLTRLLLEDCYKVRARYCQGSVETAINSGDNPIAILTIGDEALRLRNHKDYPYALDLASAWHEWTNLPFVFAVWVINRKAKEDGLLNDDPAPILRQSLDFGLSHLDQVIDVAVKKTPLTKPELTVYYQQALNYNFDSPQLEGLKLFYQKITAHGWIEELPEIKFFED